MGVGVPQGYGPPKRLGILPEPGTNFLLKMNALGGTMKVSENIYPRSMKAALTPEGTTGLQEREFMGVKCPPEVGFSLGFGEEKSSWKESPLDNDTYEQRMKSIESKSPSIKKLDLRLEGQTTSRSFTEGVNLGTTRVSSLRQTKPDSLGMLPGRKELEKEYLQAGYSGKIKQAPLSRMCKSAQAQGSWGDPGSGVPEAFGISGGKQTALGLVPRQEMGGETPCVVRKPTAEVTPPVEVDLGLHLPERPDESRDMEPRMTLVTDLHEGKLAQQSEEKNDAANIEPGRESPDLIRPVYCGKFFDRMPGLPSVSCFILF